MTVQTNAIAPKAGWAVTDAIGRAARATGTSFSYLLATAKVESGFNPKQASGTSSARGLFQFIDQTWLAMVKETGAALGYGRYADAITTNASGRYEVGDPDAHRSVMALRDDPAANAAVAGAFTKRNAAALSARLGRPPSEQELYVAHFLGPSGAARLIARAANDPTGVAADDFPKAARANRSIFYDQSGAARSFSEVYDTLAGRYDRALAAINSVAPPVDVAAPLEPPTAAEPDRFDQALFDPATYQRPPTAAAAAPIFHGLFQTDPNRGGVSRFIADLWSARPQVAAALSGSGIASVERAAGGGASAGRKS